MAQLQALILNMFEQGFLFAFLGLGVLITFRFFRFPDLTAEGSYPLGGAVAAALLVQGLDPFVATLAAAAAGAGAGTITALIHTKLRINNIVAGIIAMTALYSVNLRVMGKANTPLLSTPSVFSETVDWLNRLGLNLHDNVFTTIPIALVLLVGAGLALIWFFATDLGLAVRATGQNEAMIASLGVDTDRTKMVGLALSNSFIALSGALVAQNHGFADIGMGVGILVTGAAAVLIGEAIFGDRTVTWWIVAVICGTVIYRLLVALALRGQQLCAQLAGLPIPSVAVIAGACLGTGLQLALACDYRLASDQASIGQVFHKLGLTVDFTPELPFSGTVVSLSWAKQHQAVLQRVLAAHAKSIAWFDDDKNRDEAVKMMVTASGLKPDEVEKAYAFFRKGKFFEPTGKISRKKLGALVAALASLGDIPQLDINRLILPGVTQMTD